MKKGILITFEGIDGAGKSIQTELLESFLKKRGEKVVSFREPGGTDIGERIREIFTDPSLKIPPWSEVSLILASRKVLIDHEIMPKLSLGYFILLDRFIDSTIAYQGYGKGLNIDYIEKMHIYTGINLIPDITFLLDLSVSESIKRISQRREKGLARTEREPFSFYDKVRNGYMYLAKKEPERIKVLNAERKIYDIHRDIIENLEKNGFI